MPRKPLIRSSNLPYHVYNRTLESKFYSLNMERVWSVYMEACCILSWFYGARIQSFVLMSNHFHMVITTPDQNLDDCMCYFQSFVSREVARQTESKEYRFESPYRWSLIKNAYHFQMVYRYVYQNPVRAGLTAMPEAYRYSTLNGVLGLGSLRCPVFPQECFDPVIPPVESEEFQQWASKQEPEGTLPRIQRALRRPEFRFPKRVNQRSGQKAELTAQQISREI